MNIVPLADHMTYVDEIAQLHQAEWAHMDRSLTLEHRKAALREVTDREGIPSIYIAIDNNKFIGTAAVVEKDLDTHLELGPWISAVYVKENWRTQGIATKLVKRCEDQAKKVGIKRLYLSTEFASGLYEKLGWHTVEICIYKGVRVHVMCKVIAS